MMSKHLLTFAVLAILLVQNGMCVDTNKNRNIPNESDEQTRRYSLNHPPFSDYEDIPVKVLNDDYDNTGKTENNYKRKEIVRKKIIIEDDTEIFYNDAKSSTAYPIDMINNETGRTLENDKTKKHDEYQIAEIKNKTLEEKENDPTTLEPEDLEDIDLREFNDRKDIHIKTDSKAKARSINVETLPGDYSQELKYNKTKPYSNDETRTSNRKRSQRKHVERKRVVKENTTEPEIITVDSTTPKPTHIVEKIRTLSSSFNVPEIPVYLEHPTSRQNKEIVKRTRMRDPVVPIVESENFVYSHRGNFHYSYEGGDGTKAFEKGELRSVDGGAGEAVEGSFSYTDNDGNAFSLTYTADENGYRPVGAHLPTPPPIPPAIQRALDLLATKTTPEESVTEKVKKY